MVHPVLKRLWIIAILWAVPGWAACTGACVQTASGGQAGAYVSALNVAFSGSQTAGNGNVIFVLFCGDNVCSTDPGSITVAVTDSHNSYVARADATGSGIPRVMTFTAFSIASGSNTVSIALTGGTPNFLTAIIVEMTATAFDQQGFAAAFNSSPSVSTGSPTTIASDIVVGAINCSSGLCTAGAGYTEITTVNVSIPFEAEFKTVAGTGTQTATWGTPGGGNALWVADIVAIANGGAAPMASGHTSTLLGVGK